jgi:hypothetical protein
MDWFSEGCLTALGIRISGGGRSRYLYAPYAPELVQVLASVRRPTLDIAGWSSGQLQIGVNGSPGQTVVIDASTDLLVWQSLATNTLTSARWTYQESQAVVAANRFYRARLRLTHDRQNDLLPRPGSWPV